MEAPRTLLAKRALKNRSFGRNLIRQLSGEGSNENLENRSFEKERKDSSKTLQSYFSDIENNLNSGNYSSAKSAFDDYISFRENNPNVSTLRNDSKLQKVFDKYGINWKI